MNAAKIRNWANSPDIADSLDLREACEIESKDLRGDCQGIPYSEVSYIPSEPIIID